MTQFNRSSVMPIRPALLRDEWFETYLGRLARANGIRHPWRYDLERIRAQAAPIANSASNGIPRYGDEDLPAWAILSKGARIRYCPECLQESRYIRARWRIETFEVCTLHGLRLKAGLCEPAITSMYQHPEKREVDQISIEEIWTGAVCPPPIEKAYAHAIWSEFEKSAVGLSPENPEESLAWAILAERLMDAVVTAVRGPEYPPKDIPRLSHRARWLANAGLQITATHKGILQFLLALKINSHRNAAMVCLERIIEEEERCRSVLSRLPLRKLCDRLVAATPELLSPIGNGSFPISQCPAGHLSFERATVLIGCSANFLHLLIRQGMLTKVQKIKFGRNLYVFIHRSDVEAGRRWLASCVTYEQMIEMLGIDRKGYLALLESRLLEPIKLECWRRYYREDVYQLLCQLDNVARPYPLNNTYLQPLMGDWQERRGRPRVVLVQVLREIWRGEFPLFRKMDESGLRAYYVDVVTIDRLRWLSEVYWAEKAKVQRCAGQLSLLGITE